MSINLRAPINNLGYGVVGLNILLELERRGLEPALFPIGQPQPNSRDEASAIGKAISRQSLYNYDAPCLSIWHQFNLAESVGRSLRVGFPIFEIDRLTKIEQHQLCSLDKILICSKWAQNIVYRDVPQVPAYVVPLGVDVATFYSTPSSPVQSTIFLNTAKWSLNKGHDFLVEAFAEAFSSNEKVILWMMCDNPFLTEEETSQWHSLYKDRLGDKVEFLPRVRTSQEVAQIINRADCGVQVSRGDGWDLPLMEMLACGKHVICTNYSGHTEFCNKENSYLVDVDQTEEAYDGKWFLGQGIANVGEWASLGVSQKEQTINYLREVHKLKQRNQLGVNQAGINTAMQFTWCNTVNKLLEAIENV